MCFTFLVGRMVDAFTPIYDSISKRTYSIVKSFSGLFTPYTCTPTSLYQTCKKIVPGYMEHDPKTEAKKKTKSPEYLFQRDL
jgi:hypothetical protein